MRILLHRSIVVASLIVSCSLGAPLDTILQGAQEVGAVRQQVEGGVQQALGQVYGIGKMIQGVQRLSYLSDLFGIKLRLICINPFEKRNFDICALWNKNRKMYDYGNKSFGFSIDLGICKLEAQGQQGVTNEFDRFYSSVMDKICGKGQTIQDASYNTGNVQNSPNKTVITERRDIYFTPITSEVVGVPQTQTVSYTKEVATQDASKVKYPSGITQKELYGGQEGGYYAYTAKHNPNSTTAIAYKSGDTATLVMKDIAIKATSYDSENLISLPKNKSDEIMITSAKAQLRYVDPVINWSEFMDAVESNLSTQFMQLTPQGSDAAQMKADIESKEYKVYQDFIKSDYIQDVYKKQEDMLRTMYADLELLMTDSKDYVFDPSEAKADTLPLQARTRFKYKSLIQMTKETILKGFLGRAIKYKRELLDLALKKAYICASPYRPEIATQELKDILQNVDALAQ